MGRGDGKGGISTSTITKIGAGVAAYAALLKYVDSKIHLFFDMQLGRKLKEYNTQLPKLIARKGGYQVTDMWDKTLARHPDKEAIVFEDSSMTFAEVDKLANRVAHWAHAQGLRNGDVVALDMENRLEFVPTWLGLSKAGIVVALINCHVKAKALVHSIGAAKTKAVIFGTELAATFAPVSAQLKRDGRALFSFGPGPVPPFADGSLDAALARVPDTPAPRAWRAGRGMLDSFAFIYTSGTTGLPKACLIKHSKYYTFGKCIPAAFEIKPSDRLYCTLPLFHTAGGGLGMGAMIVHGCTLVLRRKFSARAFWSDAKKHRCTVVQYIGELCRYLLATAPGSDDKSHGVRLALGNGLRPDVWPAFQRRFAIPEIGEFYAATEGNVALLNHSKNGQGQGAVGRAGWLVRKIQGFKLVKFDIENEVPLRGPDGFCREVGVGEPGELLGPIIASKPSTRFEGYTDAKATAKKVMTDVFKKGDKYFRTGDLVKYDAQGYFYFCDRIGDTFRWKGENVSTTEVAEVVSTFPNVLEANVYGVQIPGKDGRACCVALRTEGGPESIDRNGLAKCVQDALPSYAVPMPVITCHQRT